MHNSDCAWIINPPHASRKITDSQALNVYAFSAHDHVIMLGKPRSLVIQVTTETSHQMMHMPK